MNAKETWIHETEKSLDGLKSVDTNPYLYSKILNKINAAKTDYVSPKLIWATSVSLVVLIIVNLTALTSNKIKGNNDKKELQALSTQLQLNNDNEIDYN